MSSLDDLQVLTTSIGEFSADALGRDHLRGLWLTMDPRTMQAQMLIALADNSDDAQKTALRDVFEVENVFADEVVLSYRFVDNLDDLELELAPDRVPLYSLA